VIAKRGGLPTDGHYGPLFIRMTWHAAGTYRVGDGRGGAAAPAASASRHRTAGPTTATSTKHAACCGRIKQKYGNKLSWADLLVLAGNVAIEDMGGPNHGTALGRVDIWHPETTSYWAPKTRGWVTSAMVRPAETWKIPSAQYKWA
jgi:catalase-peroxidase